LTNDWRWLVDNLHITDDPLFASRQTGADDLGILLGSSPQPRASGRDFSSRPEIWCHWLAAAVVVAAETAPGWSNVFPLRRV
jgi:hypothetical protein